MTSVLEMTVEELKRKVEKLSELGWIRTARRGDTGIGHTMEGLLGYKENNFALPDWGICEVKTTRRDSSTPITLFSKAPQLMPGLSRRGFVELHGYWDEERKRQALYTTISGDHENSLGWIMIVNKTDNRIDFVHKKEIVAFQEISQLKKKLSEKLSNLVLIIADRKKEGKDEFFRYNEVYLLAGADVELLLDLLESGDITFDWRMHLKDTGSVRDHGPGYRMLESKLPNLYRHKEKLV